MNKEQNPFAPFVILKKGKLSPNADENNAGQNINRQNQHRKLILIL